VVNALNEVVWQTDFGALGLLAPKEKILQVLVDGGGVMLLSRIPEAKQSCS